MAQLTLARLAEVSGVGLHQGVPCKVELRPAPADSGVRFVRLDDLGAAPIPAHVDRVVDTRLATTLAGHGWRVRTVEHLLAAVRGLGIDNLEVAIDGPELPMLDGTAGAWVEALRGGGRTAQAHPRRVLVVDREVGTRSGDSWVTAAPSDSLVLDLEIDFEHPLIGEQHLAWTWAEGGFEAELGWARTFGFERDVAALQRMGLIAGGSLDNALVFSEDGVRNPGGLKAPDEPVRHKAMDMLGDLALLGVPVRGRFSGCRPGHSRVIGLVRALLADPDAWHISIEASGA